MDRLRRWLGGSASPLVVGAEHLSADRPPTLVVDRPEDISEVSAAFPSATIIAPSADMRGLRAARNFLPEIRSSLDNTAALVVPVVVDRTGIAPMVPDRAIVFFGAPRLVPATPEDLLTHFADVRDEAFAHRVRTMLPLHRAFFRGARRWWRRTAVVDSMGTRLSYGKASTAAVYLARRLRALCPEDAPVGILLPPCAAGALVNIALPLAGRVTVNLNHTLSRDVIERIIAASGLRRIITSKKMLDALGWASDDRMVLLEDVGRPPKSVALLLFLGLRLIPPALWERWFPGGRTAVDAAATMMFTSGSTGVPKGVVLTHANLQANIHGFRTAFPLRPTDVMVGVLPLFHSFGYTATVWFPLLNGVCVAYHRNPLEAEAVQRLVEKERGTLILSTPTVLGVWMRTWDPAAIRSLRLVIVGAEKLREATARRAHEEFHLTVLEGYGCTEMSPVVAVNTETASRPGTVGRLLEGVRARVVSPEDGRPLPDGTAGLLLVKGPNRMAGYWNDPERTSRAMRDGWYVTGDVAVVDEEGFLSITDRLARFSKIGGEMVPHLFIEEALAAQGGPDARFFVVSVADARKGEVLVVLFNGWRGTPVEVVARLAASGVPRLWIPDARNFFEAEVWPVSGAGKADLAAARAMAERKMAERGAA